MEGQRANTIVIGQPFRSMEMYKDEVAQAFLHHEIVKITASDDAVPMAICVAHLVESTTETKKYYVDAWSSSSSREIDQHTQKIRIYMARIPHQRHDPEDLDIVLKFFNNDGDFSGDIKDAVDILSESDILILRGVNQGVLRAISVAQVLEDTEEAVKKSFQTSTDYQNHQTAKIEIEMETLASCIVKIADQDREMLPVSRKLGRGPKGYKLGSVAAMELRERAAYNSLKRGLMVESSEVSSSDSKKQCDAPLIDKYKGDVESPGASYSDAKKQCNALLIDKSKGDVESQGASSSDTEKQCDAPSTNKGKWDVKSPGTSSSDTEKQCKQCDAPSIDKRKGDIKSPGTSSSDTEKQCSTPSIDKSKGDAESPGTSFSDTQKQCDTPAVDKSKRDVESPGTSFSDTKKQCDAPSIDKDVKSPGTSFSDTEKKCGAPQSTKML